VSLRMLINLRLANLASDHYASEIHRPKSTVPAVLSWIHSTELVPISFRKDLTELGPIDRASPYLRGGSYLKTETEASLRNVVLKNKQYGVLDNDKKMDNVQKHICTNVSSSQTFRSYLASMKIIFSKKVSTNERRVSLLTFGKRCAVNMKHKLQFTLNIFGEGRCSFVNKFRNTVQQARTNVSSTSFSVCIIYSNHCVNTVY
jgi:hypothetical protein